jgi:hypothetical protein
MSLKKIDLKELQRRAPSIYKVVHYYIREDGTIPSDLPRDIEDRLEGYLQIIDAEKQPKVEPYRDTFNEESAALAISERKRLQTERDYKAAIARLQQYADEQGLADTEENVALVTKWIDTYAKSYWSSSAVDAAIDVLGPRGKDLLQWRPKVVAPPPAATPKAWKAGDPLPDAATEYQLRQSSLAEVRAWKNRQQQR